MANSLPPLGSTTGADRAAAWPICRSRAPIVLLVYRQMGSKNGPHVPKSADGKAPDERDCSPGALVRRLRLLEEQANRYRGSPPGIP